MSTDQSNKNLVSIEDQSLLMKNLSKAYQFKLPEVKTVSKKQQRKSSINKIPTKYYLVDKSKYMTNSPQFLCEPILETELSLIEVMNKVMKDEKECREMRNLSKFDY